MNSPALTGMPAGVELVAAERCLPYHVVKRAGIEFQARRIRYSFFPAGDLA